MIALFLRTLHLQPWLLYLHSLSRVIQSGLMLWKVICKLTPVTPGFGKSWLVHLPVGAEKGVAALTGWHGKEHLEAPKLYQPSLPLQQSPTDLVLGREIRHKIPGAKNSSHKDIHLPLHFQSSRKFNSSGQNFKAE